MDLESLSQFISIKSISTDAKYKEDVHKCAEWLKGYLERFCTEVMVISTQGNPIIVAKVGSGEPIVCYGHYDVQPAEKTDGWISDPFTLVRKDRRIFGRGAQDNKGQLWYVIQAVKSLVENGELKHRVIFLIEGEEESGGHSLEQLLLNEGAEIVERSTCALITDSGSVSENVECITLGLRGVFQLTLTISGPGYDLHSGEHGGLAPNPLFDVAKVLEALEPRHYENIPGFLSGWVAPKEEELKLADSFNITESDYSSLIKLKKPIQRLNHSPMVIGLYPRIEVCGLSGGYTGAGYKNIIPSQAKLKIVVRTAYNQDSSRSAKALVEYLQRLPIECSLTIDDVRVAGNPVKVDESNPMVRKIIDTIKTITNNPVVGRYSGGSIPIAEAFYKIGVQPIIFGFGLEEDQIHGPNESFSLDQFEKGFNVIRALLS